MDKSIKLPFQKRIKCFYSPDYTLRSAGFTEKDSLVARIHLRVVNWVRKLLNRIRKKKKEISLYL